MSQKVLDFCFDVGSPASYLAWTQLKRLTQETGARLQPLPMLLGGVFKATGNASPVSVPAKAAYIFKDFQRFAQRYGVAFEANPHFPIQTLLLMRMLTGVQTHQAQHFTQLCGHLFEGIWVRGLQLHDPQVLEAWLLEGGFAAAELLALAEQQDTKDRLKALTEQAIGRGVFGAPTFFVGQEMFFGQDRLDFVHQALLA